MRFVCLWLVAAASCALAAVQRRNPTLLQLSRLDLSAADLQIGTEPGKNNVVAGFEVAESWSSGMDLASNVAVTDPDTDFYLRATGGSLQVNRAVVVPAVLPNMRVSLMGDLVKQVIQDGQASLAADKERRITVSYDCLSPGTASLTLTLEIEGQSALQIPFKKTCGGEKNLALTVVAGSGGESEKVVIMGSPKWDELKVIGIRPTATTFNVYVDPLSEQGTQTISTPKAIGLGACAAQVAPLDGSGFSSGKRVLSPGEAIAVTVDYRCFRHGNCIVTTEVPFFPDMAPYQRLRWSWTKLCGGDALGIDVELPEVRRLLATDGAANKTSLTPWIAETDIDKHEIRLVNDQTRSLEPEMKIRSLTVRCLDSGRCTSRIAETVPKMLTSGSPLDLHVEYDCHSSGSSMVQLALATEGHDPVIATWAKDCSAFSDSILGCILVMGGAGLLCALLGVGCVKLCSDHCCLLMDSDRGAKPLLEGEFIEDENLTPEELNALNNYEEFYGLQKGAASIEQVKDSALGIRGWSSRPTLTSETLDSQVSLASA